MIRYESNNNATIYQISVREFPGLVGNVYFVYCNDYRVLIDTGSGFGESNQDLLTGLAEISKFRNEDCSLHTLTHIFITHGHIDHYGGVSFVAPQTNAKICIHELDRRIVSNHEERLGIAARHLDEFLIEAGINDEQRNKNLDLYKITKSLYQSTRVDITYESVGMEIGPFKFIHVPGHCAGHVLIKLDDVIFSGDHILEKTSPHQAPEQITLSTGLETYLKSLDLVRPLIKDVKFLLGGHENPIYEIEDRIEEIRNVHRERLQLILDLLAKPNSIGEISNSLFGDVEGYTILLALEETGAHIEYLYQHGYLEIVNIEEVTNIKSTVPILFKAVDKKLHSF